MTQIKSEKAKEYIWEKIPWVYLDCAVKAISIAETEAEERHAKQLQELRDKAIKTHCHCCEWSESDCPRETCASLIEFTAKLNEK